MASSLIELLQSCRDRVEGEDEEQDEWPSEQQIAQSMEEVQALTATEMARIEADWRAS